VNLHQGKREAVLNTIEFRNYRRFGSNVRIPGRCAGAASLEDEPGIPPGECFESGCSMGVWGFVVAAHDISGRGLFYPRGMRSVSTLLLLPGLLMAAGRLRVRLGRTSG